MKVSLVLLQQRINSSFFYITDYLLRMASSPPTIDLPPGMGPSLTLQDALSKVKALGKLELPPDRCPDIDGTSVSVEYIVVKNAMFVDKEAFRTGPAAFLEQATRQAKLVSEMT